MKRNRCRTWKDCLWSQLWFFFCC